MLSETTLFDRVGGMSWFVRLVERFYAGVAQDPVLRPLYPEDLSAPMEHLTLFLAQYWGGPRDYERERGHPRLRRRHLPFAIGLAEREAWVAHMIAAVQADRPDSDDEQRLTAYFESAASSLINQPPENI